MCESCRNGGKPLAAVWWRVSTEDQKTISPATQRTQALALAKGGDFQVPEDYILVQPQNTYFAKGWWFDPPEADSPRTGNNPFPLNLSKGATNKVGLLIMH
jgi:hypothetical protein